MSERIMKVLANCEQGLQDSEKLRARTNIGAIGGVRVTDSSGTTDLVPDSQGRVTVNLANVHVPLVRAAFQDGAWSKLSGDDGFVKANQFGQQALYLPGGGWWHIDATLAVKNNTAQDLLQHLVLEWEWNFFIAAGVPAGTYSAAGFPSMMHEIDYTRTATNNRCFGFIVNKDGGHTNDWLSVGLKAYEDTLPNNVEWTVWLDIFKVRGV